MVTLNLTVTVGEDRRLIVDLPPDIPTGELEITIRSIPSPETGRELTRDEIRARFQAAGLLRTDFSLFDEELSEIEDDEISHEELEGLGKMPPGTRPSEELIDEDRGEY
ncbi:MAG TPA: hypothetical protein VHL11_16710 [Phototrophicaceae bacterium]|jgi:hypothetical protein|nr:hypothetical protein [Phototrophicaceae bacterium]